MAFKMRILAVCLLLASNITCKPRNARRHFEYVLIANGDSAFKWYPSADTTYWRQIVFSASRVLVGIQRGRNDTLYGKQVYFTYSRHARPALIGDYRYGHPYGRWYEFYKSGRVRIVADKLGSQWSGKYFEFYDKPGYAPGVYKEFVIYQGKSYDNGEIRFDSIAKQPLISGSRWLPRVLAEQDTIELGDSLQVTARIRFPDAEYPGLCVHVDSGQVKATKDFFSKTNVIKFSVIPHQRGAQRLTGTLSGIKVVQGRLEEGPFAVETPRDLRFALPYYVR